MSLLGVNALLNYASAYPDSPLIFKKVRGYAIFTEPFNDPVPKKVGCALRLGIHAKSHERIFGKIKMIQ